jgi:tetratricopeptide (TPR) repeat protein
MASSGAAVTLNDYVEQFERARRADAGADLAGFLPPPAAALYFEVLLELVRIDLDHGWKRGRPASLDDYQRRFPNLFGDPSRVATLAFEEYRLRLQVGQDPRPEEYARRFGIDPAGWPRAGALSPIRTGNGLAAIPLPVVGDVFAGFQLLFELGRGTLSRVFLARQSDLAGRPVVLKVAAELFDEPQTLAQLQHTHIVPIYSFHRSPPLQAVCMPYLGSKTLADVLRERREGGTRDAGRGTRDALSLTARLADGLAHAHERGILHRDLKPANILAADDGQPLLLDFNLSRDTKQLSGPRRITVGGTVPYASPEQLRALLEQDGDTDARSDVYALGVVLFELLTLRLPFGVPRDLQPESLREAIALRQTVPRLRPANPVVSPATEAIVRHCLEPDPQRRYQSARQLQEDLDRQLRNEPLLHVAEPSLRERVAKWARRHPRLTSTGSLAAVAGACVLALILILWGREQRLRRLEAVENLRQFRQDMRLVQFLFLANRSPEPIRLEEGAQSCRALLSRYAILDQPDWFQRPELRALPEEEQCRLREEVGDLLLLWARVVQVQAKQLHAAEDQAVQTAQALELNRRAETTYLPGQVPSVLWRQRRELEGAPGVPQEEPEPRADSARDLSLRAGEHLFRREPTQALPLLLRAVQLDPQAFWSWFDLGICREQLGQDTEAQACFSTCIALDSRFGPVYFKRGTLRLKRGEFQAAHADFDRVLQDMPEMTEALINRALASLALGHDQDALADLGLALDRGTPYTRVYLIRAEVRRRLGDSAGAQRDLQEGLRRQPRDELSYLARGQARLESDPRGALADYSEALRLNPRSLPALRNQAHVLAERLRQPEDAVAVLDKLLQLAPSEVAARAARGVLLARLGKRGEAHREAVTCLAAAPGPVTLYQLAGIYALTSPNHPEDRADALHLLAAAWIQGQGLEHAAHDTDLAPLRSLPEFQQLLERMRAKAEKREKPGPGR